MNCRGIRGAITVETNTRTAIDAAVRRLLTEIVVANGVSVSDITSVIFTATPDLDAAYPARTARALGWTHVPLLCMQEMAVVGSLPRCIRVLVHWNTHRSQDAIHHVYLGEARQLRPDLVKEEIQ